MGNILPKIAFNLTKMSLPTFKVGPDSALQINPMNGSAPP